VGKKRYKVICDKRTEQKNGWVKTPNLLEGENVVWGRSEVSITDKRTEQIMCGLQNFEWIERENVVRGKI
jgi:hypothetical protein